MSAIGEIDFEIFAEQNRKNICEVIDVDYKKLLIPDQKHTDNIAVVKNSGYVDLTRNRRNNNKRA